MSMELNKESVEQAGGDERAAFEAAASKLGIYTCNFQRYTEETAAHENRINARVEDPVRVGDYRSATLHDCWKIWQEARAVLAQPSPVRSSLLINGYQLRAALDFIAPDGTAEQLESEACIEWRQQDADFLEAGLYAFCAEYPEEGGVLLDEEPTTAQPSPLQSEQAEAERPEVVARVVHSNPVVLGQCGPLNANDELMTVAQHAASVARWAEMFNRVEQQRDAALARVEQQESTIAGMNEAHAKLAGLYEAAQAQHSVPEGWMLVPVEPLLNMMSDKDHDTRITAERQLLSILAAATGKEVGHE
ncbi:TPA: hypothetical protein ACJX74_002346 [Pseudomonas aeruginosa]